MFITRNLVLAVLTLIFLSSCSKKEPSCTDGIQNQNETRIDCGGPCSPCGTCSDGILNQDETNVDCGGVCSKCATCTDGIKNQGEDETDCGGPCAKCPITYPNAGSYGPNILRANTITIVSSGTPPQTNEKYYSMAALLPEGTSLKVIISYTPTVVTSFPNGWVHVLGSSIGWIVSNYSQSTHSQEYTATGKEKCDMKKAFLNHGSGRIEIYENDATVPTRTKVVSW